MNLKQIKETKNDIYLTWDKDSSVTYYKILGMNSIFEYHEIKKATNNVILLSKEEIKDYLSIKVEYIILNSNEEIIINSTNSIKLNHSSIEDIDVKIIKSYQGYTFSFQHKNIFDRYILYEKRNNKANKIIETEDFQVSIQKIHKDSTYYVEAYQKEEEKYVIKAESNEFYPNTTEAFNIPKIKISIIIPVYNSELFLSRCIDSILLSSIKDFEILLIDDESTDNSPKIIDWYQKQYKHHIKSIHKKNEGVSFTRNKGIELATGDYIAFVDNDDLVHPYMYENLLTTAYENNAPIVIGKTYIRNDCDNHEIYLNIKENVHYDYEKMLLEKNTHTKNNIFFVAVWNKIVKKELIKEHPFPENNYYEDTAFTRMLYSYIDDFYFNANAYYVWDKRIQKTIGTSTNNYFNKKQKDPLFYQRHYRDALFYCLKKGNQKKKPQLAYDSIKESIDYLKSINRLHTKNDIRSLYNESINKTFYENDLLMNHYIKNEDYLYQYIIKLFIEKDF